MGAGVLLAAVLSVAHSLRVFETRFSDDAFILFRYARHLAHGHGLVWNVGERPIEGFTSLLMVALTALAARFNADLLLFSQILGVAGSALACLAAAWLAREASHGDGRAAVVAACGVALSPPLAAWARGGLETSLFTALLAGAIACWLAESRRGRGRLASCCLFLAASLARPEAILAVAVVGALDLAAGTTGRDGVRAAAGQMLRWWPLGTGLAVLAGWRIAYFGDLLPNVYYAKTGGGLPALRAGLAYDVRFFFALGTVNLVILAGSLIAWRFARPRAAVAVAATCILYSAHVALVGGEYQGFFRYLVPLLPLLIALASIGLLSLWDAARGIAGWRRAAIAVCLLCVAAFELALPSIREIRDRPFLLTRPFGLVEKLPAPGDPYASRFRDYAPTGRLLKEVVPPDDTIGALAVGAVGYYSERPILDLLGLNDRRIARLPIEHPESRPWVSGHMRGSAAEVLDRRPGYLLLTTDASERPNQPPSDAVQDAYPFVRDLLRSPAFQRTYVPDSCPFPDGRWMNLYRRTDLPPLRCPSHDDGDGRASR